jgi:hypothetical protein
VCQLLSDTTASLPTAITRPPGAEWPSVLANLTPADGIELRSLGWLCFKGAANWDAYGTASHALIVTGKAGGQIPRMVCFWKDWVGHKDAMYAVRSFLELPHTPGCHVGNLLIGSAGSYQLQTVCSGNAHGAVAVGPLSCIHISPVRMSCFPPVCVQTPTEHSLATRLGVR